MLSACGSDNPNASDPTSTAIPSATATPLPTSTPTAVPTATPTSEPEVLLHVDSLVCERFFPGVPNPDGPNEWLNISAEITNSGRPGTLSDGPIDLIVNVFDAAGETVVLVELENDGLALAPGESKTYFAPTINERHPAAKSCAISAVLSGSDKAISLSGETESEVTILAAP